jgi:hypothetical protein
MFLSGKRPEPQLYHAMAIIDGHGHVPVNVISLNKPLFYPGCPNIDYMVSTNKRLTTIIDTRYIKPTYEETYFTEPG